MAPARGGWHSVGATFARTRSEESTIADNAENLAMLAQLAPALFEGVGGARLDPAQLTGRAGLRCVSPDYLPLLGAIDTEQWPRVYVTIAHGSRGLLTAPIGGEVLAALLEDEPAPLPNDLMRAVAADRFARSARRCCAG
jgi:tRNA 5-methylaminomethyl-2-thiouridine biosynthesis bifunctional protein